MNILFVCTGNTCRSSMAEGILKNLLENKDVKNISVTSAGINAYEGDMANEKAILVLKNKGIDISSHRAKQLTVDLIKESDLILTMTILHKRSIILMAREAIEKVFTLKEFARLINGVSNNEQNLDIADPYEMDYNVYNKIMTEIEIELMKVLDKLIIENNRNGRAIEK